MVPFPSERLEVAKESYSDERRPIGWDDRSRNSINNDKWDREDHRGVMREVRKLAAARDQLAEVTPTAAAEMQDTWFAFMKARARLKDRSQVRDDHQVDLTINEQLLGLTEFEELVRFTRGDAVGAAMAAVKIEPTLEVLFDREKQRQKEAEELQKKREELLEALAEQRRRGDQDENGEGDGDGDMQVPGQASGMSNEELQDLIDDLTRQVEAREKALRERLDDDSVDIEATLKSVMREAADEARDEKGVAQAWGIDPGELTRMPADIRFKLASKLNHQRLRQIAELVGLMQRIAFSPKIRRVEDIPHELSSVTIGTDLEHLLPEELVRFADEDLEWSFLADYAEGRLRQYKVYGTEKIGKGGIILCEDGSGSMSGDPELMAKAVMLTLLNIAKVEGREFHLVHFGGPGAYKHLPFRSPAEYTIDHVIEAAELFFGGGTDFVTPLNVARDILLDEFARTGRVQSDIIFLTDGICQVPDAWLEEFHKDMDRLQATVWGVNVGGYQKDEPLWTICREHVCTVYDLHNTGREIKTIFQHL